MKRLRTPSTSLLRALVACLCAVGGAACTSPQDSDYDWSPSSWRYIPPAEYQWSRRWQGEPDPTIDTALASAKTTCSGSCPEDVGMLVTFETRRYYRNGDPWIETRSGRCGFTLVDEDVVQTASHCLPNHLATARPGASCGANVAVVFPDLPGKPAEKIGCSSVVFSSGVVKPEDGLVRASERARPDYALLKLARKPNRRPTQISREGFPDGRPVVIYATDPSETKAYESTIRRTECEATMNTRHAPEYASATAPLVPVFGRDCRYRQGNSGSGVRDAQGRVIGVLVSIPQYDSLAETVRNNPAAYPEGQDVFGFATNLACVEMPGFGVPASSCSGSGAALPAPSSRATNALTFLRRVGPTIQEAGRGLSPLFAYVPRIYQPGPRETSRNAREFDFMLIPVCLKAPELWPAGSAESASYASARSRGTAWETSVRLPLLTAEDVMSFDRRGRVRAEGVRSPARDMARGEARFTATANPARTSRVEATYRALFLPADMELNASLRRALSLATEGFKWCESDDVADPFGVQKVTRALEEEASAEGRVTRGY